MADRADDAAGASTDPAGNQAANAAADQAADELYALDPEEFTAARNERAKQLNRAGDKQAGTAVKGLAKPTVPAWALNQVARQQADVVAALLEAGAGLRAAQEQALAGDASGLRAATREQQGRIADVVARAGEVLRAAGKEPTAALVERMTATLRAAATDPGAGALLRKGRLTTDLSPAGFGMEEMAFAPVPARKSSSRAGAAKKRAPKRRPGDDTGDGAGDEAGDETSDETSDEAGAGDGPAEAAARRQREAHEAAARADQAEREAAEAGRQADEAEEEARRAEDRARQLRHRAREAASAAARARREATAAQPQTKGG